MPRLSHDQRIQVICLHDGAGFSVHQLSERFNVCRSTIQRLLAKQRATQSVDDLPRPGRPRRSTARQDRILVRMSAGDPHQVARQLSQRWQIDHGVAASTSTVKRRLFKVGLIGRVARRKPLLTNRHRQARLAWAIEHRNWTVDQWSSVVFSDESPIHLVAGRQRRYVRRRGGTAMQQQHIRPTVHRASGGIMIWGAFSLNGQRPLARVYGRLNGEGYVAVLQDNLLPLDLPGNGLTFQQDNAPCHTARRTTNFLQESNIAILAWPAQSPDLNPIENLWSHIQREVDQVQVEGLAGLWAATRRVWNQTPQDLIQRVIESMPRRIEQVIAAGGGSINY
jgi:transposase